MTARQRYIAGELAKVMPTEGRVKLKLLSDKGESFWLNITPEQQAAIEAILLEGEE